MPNELPMRSLDVLVALRTEKTRDNKVPGKRYLGLEHIASGEPCADWQCVWQFFDKH